MTPTPEQIAQWLHSEGIDLSGEGFGEYLATAEQMQRFAALACAWQAEQDAKLCENNYERGSWDEGAAAYNECAAATRASVKGPA